MRWASTLSEQRESEAAALDASARLRSELDGDPDLAIVFASSHHESSYDSIASTLTRELGGAMLIGCSGHSVIGGGRELEAQPGLALSGATLPGCRDSPVRTGCRGATAFAHTGRVARADRRRPRNGAPLPASGRPVRVRCRALHPRHGTRRIPPASRSEAWQAVVSSQASTRSGSGRRRSARVSSAWAFRAT